MSYYNLLFTNLINNKQKSMEIIYPLSNPQLLSFIIRNRNCLHFASTWVHPRVFGGVRVPNHMWCHIIFLFDFRIKRCSVRLYLQLFVEGSMSYSRHLCLFAHSGVQHILCCVFVRLVYTMLLVSLGCPFWLSLTHKCMNAHFFLEQALQSGL